MHQTQKGIKPQLRPSKPDSRLDTADTDDKTRDTLVSIVFGVVKLD